LKSTEEQLGSALGALAAVAGSHEEEVVRVAGVEVERRRKSAEFDTIQASLQARWHVGVLRKCMLERIFGDAVSHCSPNLVTTNQRLRDSTSALSVALGDRRAAALEAWREVGSVEELGELWKEMDFIIQLRNDFAHPAVTMTADAAIADSPRLRQLLALERHHGYKN
jgi:hypothetical protein